MHFRRNIYNPAIHPHIVYCILFFSYLAGAVLPAGLHSGTLFSTVSPLLHLNSHHPRPQPRRNHLRKIQQPPKHLAPLMGLQKLWMTTLSTAHPSPGNPSTQSILVCPQLQRKLPWSWLPLSLQQKGSSAMQTCSHKYKNNSYIKKINLTRHAIPTDFLLLFCRLVIQYNGLHCRDFFWEGTSAGILRRIKATKAERFW